MTADELEHRARRRHFGHLAVAIVWAASIVPAWLWWRDSVLFVICASVFANVYAALSALEAADNAPIQARLNELEERILAATRHWPDGTEDHAQ